MPSEFNAPPRARPEMKGPAPPSAVDQAREILKLLAQAVSAMKIFPASHSTVHRLLDDLAARFRAILEEHGAVEIAIQEQSFLFDGEVVYTDDHPQKSLPFFFHKDGLQMLFFYPGLDRAEIGEFLEIIRRESFRPPDEADIVNALWEREFGNIQYFAPDDFLESRVLKEREEWARQMQVVETDGIVLSTVEVKADADKIRSGRIELDEEDKAAPQPGTSKEEISEVESELSAPGRDGEDRAAALRKSSLNEEEVDRVELMIRSNRDLPPHQEYIDLLVEILYLEDTPALFHSTASVLEQHYQDMVQRQEYAQARLLIDRVRLLKTHFEQGKKHVQAGRLDEFLRFTRDAKIIEILRSQILDKEVPDPEGLMDFLGMFGSAVLSVLAEVYEKIEDLGFRERVFEHLRWTAGEDFRAVFNLVNEHRPVLTKVIIGILVELKNNKVIPFFANFLNYSSKDIKLQAINGLGTFVDETANRILIEFMKDPDPAIRTSAALHLRYLGDLSRVKQLILQAKSPEFRKKSSSLEQRAIYTFLGKTQTNEACAFLQEVVQTPSLFSPRMTQLRLLAVESLALMGTSGARTALDRGSRLFHKKVRRACLAALESFALEPAPPEPAAPPPPGKEDAP
jgi:hypothetical protein